MRPVRILLGILIGFLVAIPISFAQTPSTITKDQIILLTNNNRTQRDLGALAESGILDEAAQAKADDMAKKGYFSHVSPDGKTPWYWFKKSGYSFDAAGENLAVLFFSSKDVVDAWMASPSHRRNILEGQYTQIGVGLAQGTYKGRETIFVVEVFGHEKTKTLTLR